MSNSMAPSTSTISGSAGSRAEASKVSVIASVRGSIGQQGGGFCRAERTVIAFEQLRDRCRRHVEDRLRIEAEQDRQRHQGAERDDLAVVQILDASEARLVERAENDLAV